MPQTIDLKLQLQAAAKGGAEIAAMQGQLEALGLEVESIQKTSSGTTFSLTGQGKSLAELEALEGQLGATGGKVRSVRAEFEHAGKGSHEFSTSAARELGAVGKAGDELTGKIGALGKVLGSGGAFGIGAMAGMVALGGLVEGGKSMIDNAEANESAQKNLGQAFETQGESLGKYQGQIDAFLTTNTDYISSQTDVKNGFAELTRAGFDWSTTQRIMNAALDLAAIKHISVKDAAHMLNLGLQGNTRAFRDLGFSSKELNAIMTASASSHKELAADARALQAAEDALAKAQEHRKQVQDALAGKTKLMPADYDRLKAANDAVTRASGNLSGAQDKLADDQKHVTTTGQDQQHMLDVITPKLAGGRKATTDLQKSQNDLGNQWQQLSNQNGPALVGALSAVIDRVGKMLQGMRDFGRDNSFWSSLQADLIALVNLGKAIGDIGVLLIDLDQRKFGSLGADASAIGADLQRANAAANASHTAVTSTAAPSTAGTSPGGLGHHAMGGTALGWAITGEHGPELNFYERPTTIVPAPQTAAMLDNSEVVRALNVVAQLLGHINASNTAIARNTRGGLSAGISAGAAVAVKAYA